MLKLNPLKNNSALLLFILLNIVFVSKVMADDSQTSQVYDVDKRNLKFEEITNKATALEKQLIDAKNEISLLLRKQPTIGETEKIDTYIELNTKALQMARSLIPIAQEIDTLRKSVAHSSQRYSSLKKSIRTFENKIKKGQRIAKAATNRKRKETLDKQITKEEEIKTHILKKEEGEEMRDSFWSSEATDTNKTLKEEDNEFWASVSIEKDSNNSFWEGSDSKEESDSDFWTSPNNENSSKSSENAESKNKYEITYRDGKYGVLSSNGEILIPFKSWRILSYREGMARVRVLTQETASNICRANPNSSSSEGYRYNIDVFDEGIVGKNGEWLIPKQKKIIGSYGDIELEHRGLVLISRSFDTTQEEITAAKARKQRKLLSCKIKIKKEYRDSFQRYLAKGYSQGNG